MRSEIDSPKLPGLGVYEGRYLPPITLCIPFIPILTVWQTFDTVDTLPSEGAIHPQYSYCILPTPSDLAPAAPKGASST